MLLGNIVSFVFGAILIAVSVIMMRKKFYPKVAIFVALLGLIFIIGPIVDPGASFPKFINELLFTRD